MDLNPRPSVYEAVSQPTELYTEAAQLSGMNYSYKITCQAIGKAHHCELYMYTRALLSLSLFLSLSFRVSRHQPEVNLLSQQWAEFHSHYQSFNQWLRNMDTEMSNLNPYISNMATVQMQLAKLKVSCVDSQVQYYSHNAWVKPSQMRHKHAVKICVPGSWSSEVREF